MSTPVRILLAVVAAVVVLVVGSWGYRTWREERQRIRHLDELLASAEDHRLANRDSDAAVVLREALEVDPESWRAHYRLGQVYLALDRVGDAIEHLESALERCPAEHLARVQVELADGYSLRYESSRSSGDFSRSRMAYGSVSGDRWAEAKALEGLAMLWMSQWKSRRDRGDLEKARDFAQQVLEEYPDYESVDSVQRLAEFLDGVLEGAPPPPPEKPGSSDASEANGSPGA